MSSISRDVSDPLLRFCESADTPISLGVYLRVKYECWDDLINMKVNPSCYTEAYDYFIDRQAVCWLSKFPDLPTTVDRRAAAIAAFLKAEDECRATNERLQSLYATGNGTAGRIPDAIKRIQDEILDVIGAEPPEPSFFFGPGTTMSDKVGFVSIPHKISSSVSVTRDAMWLIPEWSKTAWGRYCQKQIEIVDYHRFTTVRKNALTDRGIEIQSSLNVSAQLGYGRHIRQCLKRRGLDIRCAAHEHQKIARKASLTGSHATIDLKSASDTISSGLVQLLLPPAWFAVLKSLTCPFLELQRDGKKEIIKLERFSSMGNGFTFELETLIFRAIARATSRFPAQVRVFGDDIIVDSRDATGVITALQYFGFTINTEKSFISGDFRESCGGDFFKGQAVRPYYLKENPCEPQHFISYANGVRRAASLLTWLVSATPFHRSWLRIQDSLPISIRRCRGPEYFGDLLLHDSSEYHNFRLVDGIPRYLVYHPNRFSGHGWTRFCGDTQLAAALYGCRLIRVGSNARIEGVSARDGVLSYTVSESPACIELKHAA